MPADPRARTPPSQPVRRKARLAGRKSRIWLAAVLTLVVAVSFGCYHLYVKPRVDQVSSQAPADALFVLGGPAAAAWDGWRLAQTGVARTLVLSDPYLPDPLGELCSGPLLNTVPTICFVPEPSTTQGEAQELGRLARAQGWHRVIVMTPAFHLARARLIMIRCHTGELAMVPVPRSFPATKWAYEFAYQTGGFAKALLVNRSC